MYNEQGLWTRIEHSSIDLDLSWQYEFLADAFAASLKRPAGKDRERKYLILYFIFYFLYIFLYQQICAKVKYANINPHETCYYTIYSTCRQYNTESYNLDLNVCSEVPFLANSTDTCWVLGCLCGYWLYTRSNGGDSNSTSPEIILKSMRRSANLSILHETSSDPSMTLCRHAVRTFEHLQYLLFLYLTVLRNLVWVGTKQTLSFYWHFMNEKHVTH